MTNEQKSVRDWMSSFGQETPTKPTIPSLEIRRLRAKLILEEALETITEGLGLDIFIGLGRRDCKLTAHSMIDFIDIGEPNLVNIGDGCSDLKVVTEGTLVACGLIDRKQTEYYSGLGIASEYHHTCGNDPLFDEVMRSNWTKLWTTNQVKDKFILAKEFNYTKGWNNEADLFCEELSIGKWLVKDKDGKVIKSPSYSPANLQPIIDSL